MYGLDLSEQISAIKPGGHLCLFYDRAPSEQMPAIVPFIGAGLAGNEQCLYVADDQTVQELSQHLQRAGIDVKHECNAGRLKLLTRLEWRQVGELDSTKKAGQIRQFIQQARRSGFNGIRFAVEMTWTLGPDITP